MELNRIKIVQSVIDRTRAQNYLEIGVSKGETFLSVSAGNKIAVDPKDAVEFKKFFSMPAGKRFWLMKIAKRFRGFLRLEKSRFFELASDDFFDRVPHLFSQNKIDVAFVDGLHTYEQALRDVLNCLKYLSPGGVILMHDCNPRTEAMSVPAVSVEEAASKNVSGWRGDWCGEVWKAVVHLRSAFQDLEVFVLDCDSGVGVVHRGHPAGRLFFSSEQIEKMTYQDLAKDRQNLLNLKPTSYFNEFLSRLKRE